VKVPERASLLRRLEDEMKLSHIAFFVLFIVICFAPAASTQDQESREHYSGVAIGTGGSVGGKPFGLIFASRNTPLMMTSRSSHSC
jgi:hypothetical protein